VAVVDEEAQIIDGIRRSAPSRTVMGGPLAGRWTTRTQLACEQGGKVVAVNNGSEHHQPRPSAGSSGLLSPQLTACFTSAPILASSAAVNSVSAKATGHMPPSSRFAVSLKPNVAYLVLNFCALWKKQTTLPSLA
jgi:hypothetical protein